MDNATQLCLAGFILGSAAFILLFGLAVWGLRTLNHNNAAGPATLTPVTIAQLLQQVGELAAFAGGETGSRFVQQ